MQSREFVAVDPAKCTGCGICEYACVLEKDEAYSNPLRSRIRIVRVTPLFNFALACRFCEDAPCVKACPEKALFQSEKNGVLIVKERQCRGCDWCVQACPHGGIAIHAEQRVAIACDLCNGEPKCVDFCPEEALELVSTDDAADKKFKEAMEQLPTQIEQLTKIVKEREWKSLLAEAEERVMRTAKKLEELDKIDRSTSINIDEEVWRDWVDFFTQKYGTSHKISEETETALKEYMRKQKKKNP